MSRLFFRMLSSLAAILLAVPALAQVTGSTTQTTDPTTGKPETSVTLSAGKETKKDDKVVVSKDTRKAQKKLHKEDPLAGVDANLPDKQLYDKAMDALKHNKFDLARLDLQTMLNTYQDSPFQMRAKLAIGDTWYKEGGTAALTQAEAEYKDFITFFPNVPEASEAQMKVANIYFKEMDKPDRDYTKAVKAQEEYRNMIQQFPESTFIPEAKQRLREVQEVLATRESDIAGFYASHLNWAGAIARYQTVVDTYPLFSHSDDVLVGLGDCYTSQAKIVANMRLPEDAKGRLAKIYYDQAAAAYSRVITEYPMAAHAEDARERLEAMNYPVPTPTAEQMAASKALEESRKQYTLTDRARLMIVHSPDTVMAAQVGEPSMADPAPVTAPSIVKQDMADMQSVFRPVGQTAAPQQTAAQLAAPATPSTDAATNTPVAPAQFEDVPTGVAPGANTVSVVTSNSSTPSTSNGNTVGIQIVQPGTPPATGSGSPEFAPGVPGANSSTAPADPNNPMKAVGPPSIAPLPATEKPSDAPEQINDIKPGTQPPAGPPSANAKKKGPYDKNDESSSKHKKKKGLAKLNPF